MSEYNSAYTGAQIDEAVGKALNMGDITGLPDVSAADNGKILEVVGGEWAAAEKTETTELPEVTAEDNGKVLGVVDGAWAATEQTGGGDGAGLPTVTEEDDGKLLQVVGGVWSAVAITDGNEVAY